MGRLKGGIPWNKNKKGLQIGRKITDKEKENLRKRMKENNPMKNPEIVDKVKKKLLGRKLPLDVIEKLKGRKPWNKNLKGYMAGEKHYNWQSGKSFEPYGLEFNKDLKEVIRNRDRRKCFICEKTELENNKKLDCHHIDYNKRNSNPNNLISLCRSCHIKTNNKKENWRNFFKIYK